MTTDKQPFMQMAEETEPVKEEDPTPSVTVTGGDDLEVDERLRDVIGGEIALTVPKYTKLSKGPLHVSFAIIEGSYYYQIEMDKEPTLPEEVAITAIGQAFLAVTPEHIHTYIKLPPKDLGIWLYTAISKDAAKLMGAKQFMEQKLVLKLLDIDFWPKR